MKIDHLEAYVTDYRNSIKMVVDKRLLWQTEIKPLLERVLTTITTTYKIGWKTQSLSWMHANEAVNIIFDSFPPELIDCTNLIPAFQFLPGGTLVFSQSYNGDVSIFMMYPENINALPEDTIVEMGAYIPSEITEKIIFEKVNEFLKMMIAWEVPTLRKKVGY
jgi:hypothetical protein